MTKREKQFVLAGALCGIVFTAALYSINHRLPVNVAGDAGLIEHAQPQSAESPASSKEAANTPGETVSTIQLSSQEEQQIGVETTVLERRDLQQTLKTVAQVEQPETELASVSARVSGRIDKLFVDFTGQRVRRGQEIALIYSPDIFSTAEEYRLALESRKRLRAGAEQEAIAGADDLVAAARRRLELWGLTKTQIDGIASSPKPQIDLPIFSPANGIVTERKVTEGQYVSAGESLYTLSDLSTVWVKAELYQPDIAMIRLGQPAEIAWEAPNGSTHGRVAFVDPTVNVQTRTASVRIQVPNRAMRLRPGMFVDVSFPIPAGKNVLSVPKSAVVDTGTRKIVYVSTGNGNYEGKEVRLGQPSDQYYPALAGLRAGDRVVTEGNFLIDSQTRINGGMTGLFGGSKQYESGGTTAPSAIQFQFSADPSTPKGGTNTRVHVGLLDISGKPISDAEVKLVLVMPAMPAMNMAEMRFPADLRWDGRQYAGTVKVPSSGTWNVEIEARRNGQLLGTHRSRLLAQ